MDDEFPDYADLIAQYEATEIDMLSNLDRTNGNSTINSNSNTNERLRANAPDAEDDDNSESDSEEYSQTSYTENDDDDDESQTSYTEATGNQNDEDIGGEEDDSQTSYIDDDDEDDDPEALEDYSETKDQLEDYDSDTSGGDYHSKDSFEGGMNLDEADDDDDDYESVGGDDADDNGSHTSYTDDGNDDDDDNDSHTSYTDDGKKPDPIAPVASDGSSDGEAPPTPRKKDNSDGSLDLEDLHSESSYEEDSGSDNDDDENPQQLHQDDDSHGSSYTGSSFASEDHDEHLENDDDDSHTSYEEDVEFEGRAPNDDEDRPKSHNSMESYETAESESDDESDDDEEPVDNIISKSTRDDGSMSFYSSNDDVSSNDDDGSNQEDGSYQSGSGSEESESENDNENDSYSDESDDDDDDDDKSSNDDENDSYNSEESEEAEVLDAGDYDPSESPTFNKRGDSKHSFKHPSVASGLSDNDSNQSGWEDSEGMSYTESPSNNHDDDPFEDEPKSKRKGRKTPKLPPFDDAESDDHDDNESSSDRQSEFQDEYPSNKDLKRGSFVNGNESNVEEYSTAYEGESTRSGSKMKKDVRKTSQSSMSSVDLSHIMTREKLVVDRENTVNTRERKFTRWFILASVLVLIGAIVLVTLYFVKPKKEETSPPVSFPTFAVPVISPEPTTGPTLPIIPTAEPTPLPPNKIVVETSFLAFVPDGKTNGVTTEALEEQLVDVMGVLLPPLLMDTLIFDDIFAARTRYRLRKLLPSNKDDITVGDSPSVDVVEVDCPAGSPESYLCVQVTTNVPIINSSNDFTEEFASDLKTAYSTAITGAVDKGIFSDLGSDVGLVSYVDPTKVDAATQQPTIKPTEPPKETPTEAPVASNATSVAPSIDGTQTLTQLRGSIEPTIISNFTDSNSTDSNSTDSNSTDNNSTDSNSTGSNSTDNNSTDSNSTDVSSVPTDSPANTNATASPTESVPATQLPTPIPTSKEPTQGPSSPIKETAPPTGESIDDDETCKDKNEGCQDVSESGECERTKCALWASENECSTNPEYMTVNCQKSCGLCGDTPNPPKPACSDKNDRCVEWALQNECVNNPTYMELNCRDACGFCDCQDKNDECSQQSSTNNGCLQTKCALWASQNECESNADYMGIYCRKSCDQCVANDNACIDDDDRCSGWASAGECTINPAFMQQRCAKSCGVC